MTASSAKPTPRIAVAGCGYWGRNHVRTLAELGALAAVCDLDTDLAQKTAESHGAVARGLDDVLVDPAIDGVVLALPAHVHAVMAQKVLAAGKHVFVEKPVALNAADANAVVAAAEAAGLTFMTGHILVHHNVFRRIASEIASGRIGAVRHIQSHRLAFGKFHASFDALWDLAPHDLSLILAITGVAPKSIDAHCVALASDQADSGHIHLCFDGGLQAHVHVSRHSAYNERRFVVTGEKGSLIWDDHEDWPRKLAYVAHHADRGDGGWDFARAEPEYLDVKPNMALTDELANFLNAISTGEVPLTPGSQGASVVDILEKASR